METPWARERRPWTQWSAACTTPPILWIAKSCPWTPVETRLGLSQALRRQPLSVVHPSRPSESWNSQSRPQSRGGLGRSGPLGASLPASGTHSGIQDQTGRVSGQKVKVLVTQSCPTLCDPMDCSTPGSSVHGIFQAVVLEWVAISFSRGSSHPRDQTWVSCIAGRFYTI